MTVLADETIRADIQQTQLERSEDEHRYTMRISRRTVDKLGVKLYDRVSAVVAELVANAYDADAEEVQVTLPLASLLGNQPSTSQGDAATEDEEAQLGVETPREAGQGLLELEVDESQDAATGASDSQITEFIEVIDNGHGMNPAEADANFLTVGQDRRTNPSQGGLSRDKRRPVMGRKGIGKLAPFGICQRIEVVSTGGRKTAKGYLTSHFTLDYNEIIQDTEQPYYPERGPKDRTWSEEPGTTIRLSHFQRKRVPDQETFLRQLARRFGSQQPDFRIVVTDLQDPMSSPPAVVEPVNIPVVAETRIDLTARPVPLDQGTALPVTGWIGMAQVGYKHEELAGVRIYARNKIVATTRDFGLMSGFTGENTLRSYLVGEIRAEWLDEDRGEDLIKTDRQDILWESDRGRALRLWGQDLLKEIGARSRKPRRENVRQRFLRIARVSERATERYSDETVVEAALDLAKMIGGFAAEDELSDEEYVDGLCEVILSVAPHRALMEAFREFKEQVAPNESTIESLLDLFDKTRVAELASYGQIAMERVSIIEQLSAVVDAGAPEYELQRLISKGPWIIDPTWSVITKNQALATFARRFVSWWRKAHEEELTISPIQVGNRPDFTAIEVSGCLRVVEIKAPGHDFDSHDFVRLQNYVHAFREFFGANAAIREFFPKGWKIDLVADEVAIRDRTQLEAYMSYELREEVERITWEDFIARAEQANSEFLEVREASNREALLLEGSDTHPVDEQ